MHTPETHTDDMFDQAPLEDVLAHRRQIEDELDWRENQHRRTGFTFPWQVSGFAAAAAALVAALAHFI